MADIVFNEYGDIDWNANGWPEPNPGGVADIDGYTTDTMPDDVFDIWITLCNEDEDYGADE